MRFSKVRNMILEKCNLSILWYIRQRIGNLCNL